MPPQDPYTPRTTPTPYSPAPPPPGPNGPYQQPPVPFTPQVPGSDDPARYDFFLSQPPSPRGGTQLSSGMGMRIAFAAGGLVLLIGAVFFVISLLPKNNDGKNLMEYAQVQQELYRVAGQGTHQASDQAVKNFALNTTLTVETDQAQLVSFLGKIGLKVKLKDLSLKKNLKTDRTLQSAAATSSFDSSYVSIMQSEFTAYETSIKKAAAVVQSKSAQKILSTQYQNALLLNTQLQAIQSRNLTQ